MALRARSLLFAAVALVAAADAGLAQRRDAKREADPVADLARWTRDVKRNGPDMGLEQLQRLGALVADVRMLQIAEPARREEALLSLLDLAGVRTNVELRARRTRPEEGTRVGHQTDRIRDKGRAAVAAILDADADGKLAEWLAFEVLSQPEDHPADRRIAALRALAGRHVPGTMLAVFGCAIEEERDVRAAAVAALEGWPHDDVHRFLLRQLERARAEPGWISHGALRRHFASAPLDPASAGGRELFAYARRAVLATDWRTAFRAIQLLAGVQDDPAVPLLIEALAVWNGRREAGAGSRRIEAELMKELERRSGRRIGNHPERWSTWWKAVRAGTTTPGPGDEGHRTAAAFFGLRPMTDRVVFVIDRSGSMTEPFGAKGNTRYAEAIQQMLGFLRELGPGARFRVVLFANEPETWKDRLQPATESNLVAAERWLRYRGPRGGTFLRPAIEEAMRLDRSGAPDLGRLEADSVVVLCDGATAEGPGWVEGLLARVNDDACLAFHCVQIGRSSDGTLEALAALSGGDFVEVLE